MRRSCPHGAVVSAVTGDAKCKVALSAPCFLIFVAFALVSELRLDMQLFTGDRVTRDGSSTGIVVNGRLVLLIFFVGMHLIMFSQISLLAKDILSGDGSSEEMTIPLRYTPMRVPATEITTRHHAERRLCADFAQIYFPSLGIGKLRDSYVIETSVDPWSRPSRYPPLLHLLYALTICHLPYGPASLLHLALQTTLFLASFVYAFCVLKLKDRLLPAVLLLDTCLFLTPVGLSFFERGQLTLYVGLCYLWLMLALVTGKRRYVVLAALFSFMKWTSFPFVFVAFAVSLLTSTSFGELKQRAGLAALFGFLILFQLSLLPVDAAYFLKGLVTQEFGMVATAKGVALVRVMPLYLVKALPLFLLLVGAGNRFVRKDLLQLIPFFAGAAIILVTYPTMAYDYSVPYLAAFLPFMLFWGKLVGNDNLISWCASNLFSVFLLLASFAFFIFGYSEVAMILVYVIVAVLLMGAPYLALLNKPAGA